MATSAGGEIDVLGGGNTLKAAAVNGLMIVASAATAALSGGTLKAGAIIATESGGTLSASRTVSNGGTLLADQDGSLIDIVSGGVINGGRVEIGDGIVEVKSGGTANVTFLSTGAGGLLIGNGKGHPTAYNGKISGFGGTSHDNSGQFIDLVSVTSAAGVSASFKSAPSHTSGVLTVTSGGTTVAQINLVGHYITSNFHIIADSNGHVEITDPAAPNPYAAKAALFGTYIAGFTAGGIAGGALISAPTEAHVLAPLHHA